MAKQYYSQAEAAAKLEMTEDQIKSMVRDGQLREYRDAGKVHYRVDEVDRLATKEGSSIVDLAMESGDIGLADSADAVALADSSVPPAGSGEIPLAGSGEIPLSDSSKFDLVAAGEPDLADSADVSLEGSGSSPSPKEDTKITNVGINVFDDEELQIEADPMAETRITEAPEEIGIGGVGSGSGLMDLTRESDDTSLGAELLDVISPTDSSDTEPQPDTAVAETVASGSGVESGMEAFAVPGAAPSGGPGAVVVAAGPVYYAADPTSPIFTGLMVASVAVLGLVGIVAASAVQGVWPGFLAFLSRGMNLYMYVVGGGVVAALIGAGIGFAAARAGGPTTGGGSRPKKPAKAKKGKAAKTAQ